MGRVTIRQQSENAATTAKPRTLINTTSTQIFTPGTDVYMYTKYTVYTKSLAFI